MFILKHHQVPNLTQELNRRDEEIRSLKEEVVNLHHLLQASEDEKEREIGRLKEHLEASSKNCLESDAICRSLSGETELLKTRINFLVEECQDLTKQLSNWKQKKIPEKVGPPRETGLYLLLFSFHLLLMFL